MSRATNLLLTLITISMFPSFPNCALQSQHQHAHGGGCIPAERAALLSFRKGITSNNTNLLATWHGQDCCRWRGISCNNQTGHVIKLQLRNTIDYYDPCDAANALFDITSLAALMNLNLSSNQLSGQIPNMIGAMQSLVSLDLSRNKLSGEIPSSLSSLTSLSYLNLSYNSLSGRIPSGRQLDTLSAENQSLMYIGNSGLCGPPVHKNCSGNDPSIRGDLESSKQEFDPLNFYFGLVLGFVAGLWMVFCALLFKKRWRIAYFRLFDKVYDHVYVFVVVKWASFTKSTDEE